MSGVDRDPLGARRGQDNTRPVASSSRQRLSPLPPPPPPPLPPARRYRRALRRNSRVIALVLALALPYLAAATPVRHHHGHHHTGYDPHYTTLPTGSPFSNASTTTAAAAATGADASTTPRIADAVLLAGLGALQTVAQTASSIFHRGEGDNTTPWVRIDVVRRDDDDDDDDGHYTLPADVVQLQQSVNAGFVVLSYLISLVGSLCTLELLIRRTSNRGMSNLVLLASAGICFGAVSTFAMHFVGNQSLTLHHPDLPETLALTYSAAYTILSLVASCLAMTFAFFVMGTDIHFRNWYWPCARDRRELRQRRRDSRRSARDDYSRWKVQKRLNGTTNVGTIFQQAGMVASWSLMDTAKTTKEVPRGWWRDMFYGSPKVELTQLPYAHHFNDEETMVKHDKELGELDFRFGRAAVREEIDRRHLRVDSPTSDEPASSPGISLNGMVALTSMPTSPLAAYYPTGGAVRELTQQQQQQQQDDYLRPPTPPHQVFSPDYQFPPRGGPMVDSSSTAELIPRMPEVVHTTRNGSALATAGPYVSLIENAAVPAGGDNMRDLIPPRAPLPRQVPFGRRSSLPEIQPPPQPQRMPNNRLARIQSLPEHEHDPELAVVRGSTESHKEPFNLQNGLGGADGYYDGTYATQLYDDDRYVEKVSWRKTLREKVQSGVPLTTAERVQRFFGLDIVTWGSGIKIFLTGMFAGWGVAAMHYIGQVSINDIPYIAYRVSFVVGSVIIASGAVIIALYIMFIMLRPKLKHSWTSKIIVAIILAGAVCGMHYTAMMGTIYGWRVGKKPSSSSAISGTKRAITGLVAALAFVACLGVTAFIMINSIRDRKERARRRRVVVASVLLDEHDRMLVSAIDGLLPMCDIASLTPTETSKLKKRHLNDAASSSESSALGVDLTIGNEAFVQAVKMSWSWRNPFWAAMNPFSSLTDITPSAMDPIVTVDTPDMTSPAVPQTQPMQHRGSVGTAATGVDSLTSNGAAINSRLNVARFLEKFAISATQLSIRLTGQTEGISRLGVLYDQILTTGWVRLGNGKDTVSKGQLIFLVRRVTSEQERSDLLSRHFIFADAISVATSLHKTLSTPYDHVMPLLEDMRAFCDGTSKMPLRPNTLYAGVAVVQATPFDGLRILLNQKNRSQLPMKEVCAFSTLPGLPVNVTDSLAGTVEEIGEAITWLDGMDLLSVIRRNMSPQATRVGGPRVGRLLSALERAVIPLLDELLSQDDMAYILPRLTLHPVLVPLTPASPPTKTSAGWVPPHIVVFYANYDIAVNTFADKWLPFKLFRAQHECAMASKIGAIKRTADAAAAREPGTASPAAHMSANNVDVTRYNYSRRPSKVQFEVPPASPSAAIPPAVESTSLSSYTFPPRDPNTPSSPLSPLGGTTQSFPPPLFSSRDRQPPRRSSLAKTTTAFRTGSIAGGAGATGADDFSIGSLAPIDPLPLVRPGVGSWDPDWLIRLLRTRLRAET